MTVHIDEVFGPGGLMAQKRPNYEIREGQITLSKRIAEAMESRTSLMAEAATGSGKSFAYSVPAIYNANRCKQKTMIVTAGLALQEQLMSSDFKQLKEILPWEFKPVLIKGIQNYICLDRLKYVELMGEEAWSGLNPALRQQRDAILAWAAIADDVAPYTGDKADAICSVDSAIWSRISTSSDDCSHCRCKHYEECYVTKARKKAEDANIFVTNYHMLFADIAVRLASKGLVSILPSYHNLVLDEAHEAVEIAREFFGFRVSTAGVFRIAKGISSINPKLAGKLKAVGRDFFDAVLKYHAKRASRESQELRIKQSGFIEAKEFTGVLAEALQATAQYVEDCKSDGSASLGEIVRIQSYLKTYLDHVTESVFQLDGNKVYWIEKTEHGCGIKAKMLDVSEMLSKHLFNRPNRSVILTSATLAIGQSFNFSKRETGFEGDTLVVGSPFDLYSRTLVIVPTEDGLPEPNSMEHLQRSASLFKDVIELCKGRTLGLFTSWTALNAVAKELGDSYNGYQILKQGEMTTRDTNATFKGDISSVLLATRTYWTGIDVPGEALTCVVVHKLPFANFKDPVIDAMKDLLGDRFFPDYYTPSAIMHFRQGVGRLIRSKSDYGIVVVLDPRVVKRHRSFIVPGMGAKVSVGFTLKEIPPFLAKFE